MIKNYAKGAEYISPTVEKMLNTPPYEKERAEALKWFQENLLSPTLDHRTGACSVVSTSDDNVRAITVGSLCGLQFSKELVQEIVVKAHNGKSYSTVLTPKVMRELASALLVCAERSEHPTEMIVEK